MTSTDDWCADRFDPTRQTVIVGMSGGVDSSVAAALLLDAGFRVEGLFMKNWEEDDGTEYCTAKEDLADAEAVAERLGIRLHQANFAAEYWDGVFARFLTEYERGRTPNPDVLCNREIKFKQFLDYAELLGADLIATGHYVRTSSVDGEVRLLKGRDDDKDQSYFLHEVPANALSKAVFPVGGLLKAEVRRRARDLGLATHDKADSTGICFIGERRFNDFLARYIDEAPGPIETDDGEVLGQHRGLSFHTIGQRQGLGIGGVKNRAEQPWYVVEKDVSRNVLVVAQGNDHPSLFWSGLRSRRLTWIDGHGPRLPFEGAAKIRYRQADQRCRLISTPDGYHVEFDEPQRAVTPGQSICFYEGDRCLGGGVIEEAVR